jgi:5,5'-dehydrodivanillate O-demethylase
MSLSPEENQTLTQVGPGTPMGDLLRRYWQPIGAAGELDEAPLKRVRLLGEDLVLYRDRSGTLGLIEAFCAHRGTDLAFGIVEDYGIRCPHQGWLYSETGQCLDMPLEPEPFAGEIRLKAYSVAIKAGLIWAYLGPQPAPLVPDYEPFTWQDGLVQIVFADLPCNWLQCQENSLDPVEIEWFQAGLGKEEFSPPPPPLSVDDMDFEEFEHGFAYRRRPPGASGDEDWRVGRTCIWPNGVFSGDARSCHFDWKVPVDDSHTVNVSWFIDRVAPGTELPEKRVFHWYADLKKRWQETVEPQDGGQPYVYGREEWITSHPMNRSFVIWLNQAPIVDRSKEHLADTDKGVVMLRDKLFSQVALIADGGEPKAVLRDPAANHRLLVPFSVALEAPPAGEQPEAVADFPYLAGQPEDVAEAYRAVLATWQEHDSPR